MIVYIESNFILEIVLKQTHAATAEAILKLAENGKIELAFPSFSLSEPFATVTRRQRDQDRLGKSVGGMLEGLQTMLSDAAKKERDGLWITINRLVKAGTSIEINTAGLEYALECQQRYRLSPQDSIVYAATIIDMQRRPLTETKCFLNSNYKDFAIPPIITELNTFNCWYERHFGKGLSYIRGFI